MKKLLGIIALGLLWCNVATADMTVKLYKQYKNSNDKILRDGAESYINGAGKGIFSESLCGLYFMNFKLSA